MRRCSQQNVETPFGKATAFVGGYCVDFSEQENFQDVLAPSVGYVLDGVGFETTTEMKNWV